MILYFSTFFQNILFFYCTVYFYFCFATHITFHIIRLWPKRKPHHTTLDFLHLSYAISSHEVSSWHSGVSSFSRPKKHPSSGSILLRHEVFYLESIFASSDRRYSWSSEPWSWSKNPPGHSLDWLDFYYFIYLCALW